MQNRIEGMTGLKTGIWIWAAAVLIVPLSASDQEANEFLSQGREREKSGSYRRAASRYMDAHLMADSSVLRGNLLIAAARAKRKAGLYGEEFDCLQRLIQEHLAEIDFSKVVDREYKIGDLFFAGHRDVPYIWLPFIREKDRTVEIYEAALKNAPCHERAAETRLRLSRIYIDDQKIDDAVRHLREIPKLHPQTPSAKYAMLELCSLLYQMAERGDGDGSYSRQTIEACDNYLKEFPKTPEVPWVKKTRQKARNGIASRIYSVGNYYYRQGKPELAEKYLADVVRNYSNTSSAVASEKLLARIDEDFEALPGQSRRYRPYREKIVRQDIPGEDEPIMVTPEHSGNRWLLPVRNLKKSPAVIANDLSSADFEQFKEDSAELNREKEKQVREENKLKAALKKRSGKMKIPEEDKKDDQENDDAESQPVRSDPNIEDILAPDMPGRRGRL